MRPHDDSVSEWIEKILTHMKMLRINNQVSHISELRPLPSDVYLDIHEDVDFDKIISKAPGIFHMFPARGIFYSYTHRVCFVFYCTTRYRSDVPVVFIIDTGSRNTHMTEKTIQSLGYSTDDVAYPCVVSIAGKKSKVHLSISHFKNANILGQDYLMDNGMTFVVDYKNREITLKD